MNWIAPCSLLINDIQNRSVIVSDEPPIDVPICTPVINVHEVLLSVPSSPILPSDPWGCWGRGFHGVAVLGLAPLGRSYGSLVG